MFKGIFKTVHIVILTIQTAQFIETKQVYIAYFKVFKGIQKASKKQLLKLNTRTIMCHQLYKHTFGGVVITDFLHRVSHDSLVVHVGLPNYALVQHHINCGHKTLLG